MSVSDWSDGEDQRARSEVDGVDARAAMSESLRLLHELRDATIALGDSLVRAGLPSDAWRQPDALLAEISGQSSLDTVDALLSQLTEFAASSGPQWLAGDGASLDDFEHEARTLASIARPLRAVARRERLAPPSDRSPLPFGRALADAHVGAHLDRVAQTLQRLFDLAPLLAPLPPEAQPSAAHDPVPAFAEEPVPALVAPMRAEAVAAPGPLNDETTIARVSAGPTPAIPIEDDGAADAPTYVTNGQSFAARHDAPTVPAWRARGPVPVWPRSDPLTSTVLRRRRPALLLLVVLLVGAGALGLAVGLTLPTLGSGGQPPLTSAQSTALAGQLARAATLTHTLPTPTIGSPTPASPTAVPLRPAQLSVAPSHIILPCPGRGDVSLTLSNSGDQSLTWQASISTGVVLSSYLGTLDPHGSTTITVNAVSFQRGTITFTWGGGAVQVSYRVACH